MFEQSILLDHSMANRTRALAAAMSAQTFAVSLLVLLSVIFADHLPVARLFVPVAAPLSAPPIPEEPVAQQATPSASPSTMRSPVRVFRAPATIPTQINPGNSMIDVDLPGVSMSSGLGADATPGVVGGTGIAAIAHVEAPKPKPVPTVVPKPEGPVPVGGKVQEAKLIQKVVPLYPALAKQVRISGTVHLIGVIAKDGTIQQLKLVSGHPLLVDAALGAVRQWVYRPTLLNGEAVEVIAPIDVIFTLSQ